MYSDRNWQGKWISAPACPPDTAPVFRKRFEVVSFTSGYVYLSGVGFYELYLNGCKVGDHLLSPAFTAYDKTVLYNGFDITALLQTGENLLEVTLGNGWFNETAPAAWEFDHATWRSTPQFILDLMVDGQPVVCSDRSWQASASQTVFNSLRGGETYDASAAEQPCAVAITHGPGGYLKKQSIPPIRLRSIREPKAVTPVPGGAVYDFGVNLSGNAEICVKGTSGQKITLLYTERLHADGTADPSDNNMYAFGGQFQQDEYILGSKNEERWHSRFTYHGFRYVQVSGEAQVLSLRARCFHTDLTSKGGIETDYAPVQQLHDACVRSTLTNFHHIPTDCPHREKNGWTGDAHLSCEQALFNLDMNLAYQKYMDDLMDGQRPNGVISCISPTSIWGYNWGTGPTWDAALFEIPWQTYRFSGDLSILRQCEPAMDKYLTMLRGATDDHIYRSGLGDWCAPERKPLCSTESLLTAYAWYMHHLYAQIAALLGMPEKAAQAAGHADEIRKAFQQAFIGKETGSQTFWAMLLYFRLTDDPETALAELLKELEKTDWHLWVGIFGAKFLLNVLTEYGRFDIAWKVAMREGYPGYLDMLSRCSGTLGEQWDGENSRNHHMYSEIGAWFYKALAGIRINKPGFEQITLAPHIPAEIARFTAWHDTPHGRLEVRWDEEQVEITLPEGVTATLVSRAGKQPIDKSISLPRSQFGYE